MRRAGLVIAAAGLLVVILAAGWFGLQWFGGGAAMDGPRPAVVAAPPLPPPQSTSTIIAPVTIPIALIRDAVERAAPKTMSGRVDNPAPQLIQNADIAWTAQRGLLALAGAQDALTLNTPITGRLTASGALSGDVQNALGSALGNLFGGNAAKRLGSINIKQFNGSADIAGQIAVAARPQLMANWRIEPGLTAQVAVGESNVSISGVKLNIPGQVKPVIDRNVNEQLAVLQARIRNDPVIEENARREWAKVCRSIPLKGTAATVTGTPAMPDLWLELKPVRAIAAQPRVDALNVVLTLGLEAQTRITTAQTKPDCPFPATLDLGPPSTGRLNVGMPVDLPFTEIDRIVKAQLIGKTFPEDRSGPVSITVKGATVTPSGDRLLISLLASGSERKSFMGFSGEATIHVWGRPVLDRAKQVLRLSDLEIAVESEAAFGLLGTAAKVAMPFLQRALAERAVIDLKPIAADAKARIAGLIGELKQDGNGVRVDAAINAIALREIAFDSQTLRVVVDADGAINVAVTAIKTP